MPREVSLGELKAWARQLSDTENDPNITELELNALANRHIPEVFDRLVDAGPADYHAATTTITTTPGFAEYPLTAEFRNLVNVFVVGTTIERRLLRPMPEGARGRFRTPTGTETVIVEFIPVPTVLEDDGDTFDGVSGFEELIVNLMARDVMAKRESDPSVVMANIARMEHRIVSRSRARDRGGKQVTDLDDAVCSPLAWSMTSRLACYRLRAGNLELYESLWWGA